MSFTYHKKKLKKNTSVTTNKDKPLLTHICIIYAQNYE